MCALTFSQFPRAFAPTSNPPIWIPQFWDFPRFEKLFPISFQFQNEKNKHQSKKEKIQNERITKVNQLFFSCFEVY